MPGALEGVRVVDLSHVLAAPTCSMYLGDLGAEVFHVEPKIGDDAREFGPFGFLRSSTRLFLFRFKLMK